MSKKLTSTALILGGLATYAIYKLSKMSEEEKKQIADDLLEKGKSLIENLLPGSKKNSWGNKNVVENTGV
jgi:hypothetical protein